LTSTEDELLPTGYFDRFSLNCQLVTVSGLCYVIAWANRLHTTLYPFG